MGSSTIFIIIFIIFCGFLIGAGLFSKKWVKESSDFVLAGREISTPINIVGVCAIGFAGTTVTLAPAFTLNYGLIGGIGWGAVYAVCGLMLFGLLYSNFIRRSGAQTLPEYLEMRYDSKTRSVVAITSVIGMCGIMANNVVSSVDNIAAFTGWSRPLITAVIFAVIIIFTFISGLWATTITDLFQITIGVIVVPTVFFLLAGRFGWTDAIAANWGPGAIGTDGFAGQLAGMKLTYPSFLNFFICFAAALVWGNNYYWMKIANCRNEHVARKSFVMAAIILLIVFMIPLSFVGSYMGAFYPEMLTINGGKILATGTYGFIASTFMPLFGSIVVISACAASISTASTSALGASAVANRDIYQRIINPNADAEKKLKMSKIIMLFVGVVTFILCQFPGGPTYLFAFANSWLVPPAVLLGLGAIWPKFNAKGALWGAVCGMVTMAVFTLLDLTKIFSIGRYVFLATLGLAVTLIVAVIASYFGKPRYYGEASWERVPNGNNRSDVKLEKIDFEILTLMRLGHQYMADITDSLGVDSKISGAAVERLDRGGYLMRMGLKGSNFFTFELTEKGQKALEPLNDHDTQLSAQFLSPMYLELLKTVEKNPEHQAAFVQKNGIASMQMAAISSHLTRRGYIEEKGLFKRKLIITPKGRKVIEQFSKA
ncbi:MAG: solute:Na+ symporter, family [Clostridiales bacterium]|jgi:SSS family solute:Na+ symporter|nr:solute:Na+ symporter, family [Clostridiales bacterium]MDN5298834.1 solute:Na+ symporter, family [Clostridiales bacterium]